MRGTDAAPDVAAAVQRRCVENDLLVLTCGIDDNVVRLLPPLTIGTADLDRGLDILEQCVVAETSP
jgi:4-aminobutyrate aminotransferase-like enzyme